MANLEGFQGGSGQLPNSVLTPLGQKVWGSPSPAPTPPPSPQQYPSQYAQAQNYGSSPASSGGVDPTAFGKAMNEMSIKMHENNKLISAKNAVFKHMYDQPLTDEEKGALTPALAHAISTGNRNMIDAAITDVNQQLKGYNSTIDTNLSKYADAISQVSQLKQDIAKQYTAWQIAGASQQQLDSYVRSMGLNPADFNQAGAAMRTDRNMNPTAMTTDVAKSGGLVEGVDYMQGDPFVGKDGKTYYTAKFLGDPIQTTIKAIDNMGFYTSSGQQRWSYIGMQQDQWMALTPEQKSNVVKGMYQNEGGNGTAIGMGPSGTGGAISPIVQSYVDNIASGTITSIAQVPAAYKNQVSEVMASQGVNSPLGDRRYTLAATAISAPYRDLPGYKLTADGLPYLSRIAAASQTPGSVSDQDLVDSLTKLNSSGNAITDAQVSIITGGKSFADSVNIWKNKFSTGGILSSDQRQQIVTIANSIYANYAKQYQPIYDTVSQQLTDAQIPKEFWTMPDLNDLAQRSGLSIPVVSSSSSSSGSSYKGYTLPY